MPKSLRQTLAVAPVVATKKVNKDKHQDLLPALDDTVSHLIRESGLIQPERKAALHELTLFIRKQVDAGQKVYLNFICTHNSRRSHMAQLWAQAAACYYGLPGVECFSGGTEATEFNPRAVEAMKNVGFLISTIKQAENPVYEVRFARTASPVIAFSKKYNDPFNPRLNFAAIMTCSHADEKCPVVAGASARIVIAYDDPKDFDGTPQESDQYHARALQIGREMLFAFANVRGEN